VERVRGCLSAIATIRSPAQHGFWSTGPGAGPLHQGVPTIQAGFWASFASILTGCGRIRHTSSPLAAAAECTMGKDTGFLEIEREQPTRRKVERARERLV